MQPVVVNGKISLDVAVEQITPHDWRLSVTVELASSLFKQDEPLNAVIDLPWTECSDKNLTWKSFSFFFFGCVLRVFFKVRGELDANSLAVMDYQMKV